MTVWLLAWSKRKWNNNYFQYVVCPDITLIKSVIVSLFFWFLQTVLKLLKFLNSLSVSINACQIKCKISINFSIFFWWKIKIRKYLENKNKCFWFVSCFGNIYRPLKMFLSVVQLIMGMVSNKQIRNNSE